jgi:carboxypeptidase Q
MQFRRTFALSAVIAVLVALPLSAQWPMTEKLDLDAIYRIKEEGLQRSKVMEIESYLTDVYGPRLTGSPNMKEAADWAQKTMKDWGLANVHLESWPFGRGWQNQLFVAMAMTPRAYPLIAYPKAWTPGTNGPVTGEAVIAVINEEKDFATFRGKLRGKFVLGTAMRDVPAHFEAPGRRYTEAELADLSKQPEASGRGGRGGRGGNFQAVQDFNKKKTQFWIDEGIAALLDISRGDGGTLFVQGGGSRDPKDPPSPPQVVIAVEQYGRIVRTLEKKIPVTLSMNIDNKFYDADLNSFNVVGELPGTDKADEVVMIGAHFDSWHTGTGATDNAAGSAIMMEAMRLLKTTGVKLRRTVRIGLWGGEEEGLLGSKEYVKAHYGDPATMQLKPEHAKLAGYFNVDNGTGLIRGVYLQGNEAVAPIFQQWMEPFKNMGMTTLTIRNTGGTDHLSYDAVGLSGFQFIQDEVEYNARTHHSNMDVYERIQANDMMRNAVIVASFVMNTANRDEKLPRKPLPTPQPRAGRGTSQP